MTAAKKTTGKPKRIVGLREQIARSLVKVVMESDGCWHRNYEEQLTKPVTWRTFWDNTGAGCSDTEDLGSAQFLKMADAVMKFVPPILMEAPSYRALLGLEDAA